MTKKLDTWRVVLTDAAGDNATPWEGPARDAAHAIEKARAKIDLGEVEPVADVFNLTLGSGK